MSYVQSSFASSVISALGTLEIGQFCSASRANRAIVSDPDSDVDALAGRM
jgi:hypothetical protein